jgi:hypothetical protein
MLSVYQRMYNPSETVVYIHAALANQPVDTSLLMRMEKATIDMRFACAKNYFMLMCNIKRACFTALNASINDA